MLKYLGDAIMLRLVLKGVRERSADAFAKHAEVSPELYGSLDEQLEAAREYLGDGMKVLEVAAAKFSDAQHQGHSAAACVEDTESVNWLYATVHEALLDQIDFDESDVARELKQVDRIVAPLQGKAARL